MWLGEGQMSGITQTSVIPWQRHFAWECQWCLRPENGWSGYEGFSFHPAPGLFSGSATTWHCCKPAFSCHLEEKSSLQLDPFSQELSSTFSNPHWHLRVFLSWKDRYPGEFRLLVWQSGSKMCCSYGLYDADPVNHFCFFTCSLQFSMRSEGLTTYGMYMKDFVFPLSSLCCMWNRCTWLQRRNKTNHSREDVPGSFSAKL